MKYEALKTAAETLLSTPLSNKLERFKACDCYQIEARATVILELLADLKERDREIARLNEASAQYIDYATQQRLRARDGYALFDRYFIECKELRKRLQQPINVSELKNIARHAKIAGDALVEGYTKINGMQCGFTDTAATHIDIVSSKINDMIEAAAKVEGE